MTGSNEKKVLYKTEMTLPCAHCRNVLLALDHSDRCKYAIEWSIQNIINPKTDMVYILHVIKKETPDEILKARDLLGSIMTLFKIKEIHHHAVLVLAKNIADAVVSCCDDYGIELLIVSATPVIFDTNNVSLHCVKNCRCKVLVVKPVEDNLVKIDDE